MMGSPVTKSELKTTLTVAARELSPLAKAGKLTVEGIKGRDLSLDATRLLAAAKAGG
jgi:hypothetical protein